MALKVLIVNMTLDRRTGGGTAEKAVQIARELHRAGDEVEVLTAGEVSSDVAADLDGVRITILPLLNCRFWIPAPRYALVRAAVDRSDVVLLSNHWTLINLIVSSVCRRRSKPYVVVPSGALALFGRSRLLKRAYNAAGGKRMVRHAQGWIATTRDEVAQFEAYAVPASDVCVIPNAIDMSVAETPPRLFRERNALDAPFILFVGRLSPIKGPDLLLRAFAGVADDFPQHLLVLAGPDEGMRESLARDAAAMGIAERLRFPGFLSGEEKWSAYAAADAVVIPSRQEAMSIVVLEAGRAGVPVLMTDRCGMNDLQREGVAMVSAAEAEALARKLRELLDPRFDRAGSGRRLREYVARQYSWLVVVGSYREVLRNAVSGAVRS